jgi:ABC-type branched-subunit amino acid transport system substrate-binding protein
MHMTDHARPEKGGRWSKWPALLLLVLVTCALVFAACGDDDDDGGSSGDSGGDSGSEQAAADAPKGEPILTYTFADVNTQGPQYKNIQETARVFMEWTNAHGGIKGRPLEAKFCDMKGTPTDAAACARKAVADDAVAVVGSFSFTGDAIVPILDKAGISYFGNCCSIAAAELTTESVFPMGNQPLYGVGLVKRAVEDGCQNINGVIIEGAEAFKPLLDNAAKALNTKIGKYVTLPGTAKDYSAEVAEATDGADCLVMIVSETPYIAWMPAFAQSGSEARMYGPQGNLNEKVAEGFEEVTDGDVISGMYPDISGDAWSNYREALEEYDADSEQDYNSLGGMGTWAAYEGFKQIVEGIQGPINSKTFLEAAGKAQIDLPGMVPPLDFTKPWKEDGGPPGFDRLFNRCVIFSQLKGGELEPLTTEFEDVSELAGGKNPANCG